MQGSEQIWYPSLVYFQSPNCKQLPETNFISLGRSWENLGKEIGWSPSTRTPIHWIWWRFFHHLQHCQSERVVDLWVILPSFLLYLMHVVYEKISLINTRESLNWNKLSDILFLLSKNGFHSFYHVIKKL